MLFWQDLKQTVTRRRESTSTVTPQGNVIPGGYDEQTVQATIQRRRATDDNMAEGIAQNCDAYMYCNFLTTAISGITTDIQNLDTILDQNNIQYRVIFAFDEGGLGDHLRAELQTLTPTGD